MPSDTQDIHGHVLRVNHFLRFGLVRQVQAGAVDANQWVEVRDAWAWADEWAQRGDVVADGLRDLLLSLQQALNGFLDLLRQLVASGQHTSPDALASVNDALHEMQVLWRVGSEQVFSLSTGAAEA
jgi:hypothetical protein